MKHSTIFKSRWMALLWAAGILWFAADIAAPDQPDAADQALGNAALAQLPPDQQAAMNVVSSFGR